MIINQPFSLLVTGVFWRTKHIEINCHFIHDLVIKRHIVTLFIRSEDQLGNILTKSLACSLFSILCSKLSMFNFYASI